MDIGLGGCASYKDGARTQDMVESETLVSPAMVTESGYMAMSLTLYKTARYS